MKQYIFALFLSLLTLCTTAAPVFRVRLTVTLDDGRTVAVTACGDETFDFFLTDDGQVVLWQDSVYHCTGLTPQQYFQQDATVGPRLSRKRVGTLESALIKPQGKKKIPVILTAFRDRKFSVALSDKRINSFYDKFFNGTDITESTGNWGSVRQYFVDQSIGQFEPEFSVIGPVMLDSAYSYYGEDRGSAKDIRYSTFIREAFTKAVNMENDWTQFDNDGNGKVDMCVVIYAGLGQNYTNGFGDKNTIWPKENPETFSLEGVTLQGCTSSSELRPKAASGGVITETQPDGIGVIVHEISHALGLPDLYDRNNREFGLDFWSVMDYGMYTRNAKAPVGYTAYERDFMGWQSIEEVDRPTTLRLECFARGGKGYKIVNDANPNEYYVLDNRQAEGWDWGMCSNRGHGMLVMHVDYKQSIWTSNNVNTVNAGHDHQSLTIIPANGTLIGSNNFTSQSAWQTSLQGNPYPGITGNSELTDSSTPASIVYTGTYMGKPLVDIEETEDGIITVKVMPLGKLLPPVDLSVEELGLSKAKAVWAPVENAEMYNLRLWCEGEEVLRQDSIAATTFTLEDLRDDVDYTFSIQAIGDSYRNSEWKESPSFRGLPDAITDIKKSAERVRIYDMNGRLAGECFADKLYRYSLRHGIYVVRQANGKIRKIML